MNGRENKEMNPAKKYMLEYIHLRHRRDALINELEQTREACLRATSRLSATRLSGTSSHGGMEDNVIRGVDCEAVLRKNIDKIGQCLEERLDMIDRLPDERQKAVLTYRYVNGQEWSEIMRVMRYERTVVYDLHGKALTKIQQFLKSAE